MHKLSLITFHSEDSCCGGTCSRFSACSFIKMLVFLSGHAVSSMQAIWSCHNVVKEPICTLPWQSLALDQLKYLQIGNLRVNIKFNVGSVGIIPIFFCSFSTPPSHFRLLWNTIWDHWDTCVRLLKDRISNKLERTNLIN